MLLPDDDFFRVAQKLMLGAEGAAFERTGPQGAEAGLPVRIFGQTVVLRHFAVDEQKLVGLQIGHIKIDIQTIEDALQHGYGN